MDLEAYFARIGYRGSRAPTLETLRALHAHHTRSIAFENLNPLFGWPVPLDLSALEEKLVRGRRGGYCFEQNGLFSAVLRALGYEVTDLAARVLWNTPEEVIRARTHMLLKVDLGSEPYLADVGFGGQTLTGPIRLEVGVEQATPHEPFRLLRVDGDFKLQSLVGGEWRSLYRFDLQPQVAADYDVINYYVGTNQASRFRVALIAARALPGRRCALLNKQLSLHHLEGPSERRLLGSVREVRAVLEETFGLAVPEGREPDSAIARACGWPV